jgi:YaiO family outer membrane protein
MRMRLLLALLCGIGVSGAAARDLPAVFHSAPYVEVGFGGDRLTRAYSNWRHQYLDVLIPMAERGLLLIQGLQADRFASSDQSLGVTYAYPTRAGIFSADVALSHQPVFLARDVAGAAWTGFLPGGVNLLLNTRRSRFADSETMNHGVGLEVYRNAFRVSALASHSKLEHRQSGWVRRWQAQWLGQAHRAGITYAAGSEPTMLSPGRLTGADVETVQVDGVFSLGQGYALTTAIWQSRQGEFYRRTGMQLGIRISF